MLFTPGHAQKYCLTASELLSKLGRRFRRQSQGGYARVRVGGARGVLGAPKAPQVESWKFIVAGSASPTLRGAPEAVRQYFWACPGVNNIRRVQFEAWERVFAHFIYGKKSSAWKKKVSPIGKSASEQDDVVIFSDLRLSLPIPVIPFRSLWLSLPISAILNTDPCDCHYRSLRFSLLIPAIVTTGPCDSHYRSLWFSLPIPVIVTTECTDLCGSHYRSLWFSLPIPVIVTTDPCDCHYRSLWFSLPIPVVVTTDPCDCHYRSLWFSL